MARRALHTFKEVIMENPTIIERDAAIQRFEYTVEATWKACQRYLNLVHGITSGSPKQCIRASREVGLLTDSETVGLLGAIDDRNLTSHTYNEILAVTIYSRLQDHFTLLKIWIENMYAEIVDEYDG